MFHSFIFTAFCMRVRSSLVYVYFNAPLLFIHGGKYGMVQE